MIRVLVMIAVSGFILCVATLSAAVALGGPAVLSHAAWTWGANRDWDFDGHWDRHGNHDGWADWSDDKGPQTTREIAWTGGGSLDVDIPAEVRYTQAPGAAKLTVTGPERAVADVEVKDGHIRFDHGGRHWRRGRLTVTMTAPDVTRFGLTGASRLTIADYKQARLSIDLSGSGDVVARGEADVVDVDISGSARADLGKLKAKGAEVAIAGSGEAIVAPTDWAKIDISGSGDVSLLTRPPKLDTDISGSGSVHQENDAATAPSPTSSSERL